MIDRNKRLARKRLDKRFKSFRPTEKYVSPRQGWLRAIRDALGMTGEQFATRIGISRQRVSTMEHAEADGSISLNSLRKAAAALDSTFVYAIVPRMSLEDTIREQARAIALRALGYIDQTMELEDQAVSDETLEDRVADYIQEHIRKSDLWSAHWTIYATNLKARHP